MRSRSWRRFQTERIINKRIKIYNSWGAPYNGGRGYFSKWNLTCGCKTCKFDNYLRDLEKRQKDIVSEQDLKDFTYNY